MNHPNLPADDIVRATGAWYDEQAEAYRRRTADYDSYPGLIGEIQQFVARLKDADGPVLDLGCGAGRDSQLMADRGLRVVGADLSEMMVRMTAARCGSSRTSCVRLDMRRLPFLDRAFSGAWVCASLVHVPESAIDASLAELFRVLLPGAEVAISMRFGNASGWRTSDMSAGRRWFTIIEPGVFSAMLDAHGFVDVSVVSSGRREWYIAHAARTDPLVRLRTRQAGW